MREWKHIEALVVFKNSLLADALFDPSIVHNVSHLVVLHLLIFCPNIGQVAIFLHHVVRSVILANNFASMLNNSPTDILDSISGLSRLHK